MLKYKKRTTNETNFLLFFPIHFFIGIRMSCLQCITYIYTYPVCITFYAIIVTDRKVSSIMLKKNLISFKNPEELDLLLIVFPAIYIERFNKNKTMHTLSISKACYAKISNAVVFHISKIFLYIYRNC